MHDLLRRLDHVQPHVQHSLRVIVRRALLAALVPCHHHVRVSDRLHLVAAVLVAELVEGVEHLAQHLNQFLRLDRRRHGGVAHDVGEEDRDLLMPLRDREVASSHLELLNHVMRQHLVQQLVRLGVLHLRVPGMFHFELSRDARHELLPVERLRDVVRSSRVEPLADARLVVLGRHEDHRQEGPGEQMPQLLANFVPAHDWHHHVQQNQVRQVGALLELC
mmetsp:Transcript_1255/g.3849  ORF Transcript_1255/g.3849 Transcript_1255/m.3849 type:complete len:220 (-) Transcript_1255:278-937(-)